MAIKTWTELHDYVQEHFTENYDEDITAEQLRIFLIDFLDSVSAIIFSGEGDLRWGGKAVTTAGTTITLSRSMEDLNYKVIGHVISGYAEVRHHISDFTVDDFKVTPVQNGFFVFIVVPITS